MVVTVVGAFLGWVGVQLKWIKDRHKALTWAMTMRMHPPEYKPTPWSIRLLERGVSHLLVTPDVAKDIARVAKLKQLFPESKILLLEGK